MISLIANIYILAGNAKTAHWNIQGSAFYGIHKLLDETEEMLRSHGDKLAERMRFHQEMPDITLAALKNFDEMPELDPGKDYKKQTQTIVDGLLAIHSLADDIRDDYDSCENSMLDMLQEDTGKYIYLLTSIIS